MHIPTCSATVYFWAKSSYITDDTEPKLTTYDTDRNICFSIRGTTAWLQKYNLVSRSQSAVATQSASDLAGAQGGTTQRAERSRI